jgi:hypothetical protein
VVEENLCTCIYVLIYTKKKKKKNGSHEGDWMDVWWVLTGLVKEG